MTSPPVTPDGRYLVVRGRLWRASNPNLAPEQRQALVNAQAAKVGLGERGPPWWGDGAPDLNRRLARNTIYADWFARLDGGPGDPPCPETSA